jgi:hypothetical protein
MMPKKAGCSAVEYAKAPFSWPSLPLFFAVVVFVVAVEDSTANTAGPSEADGVTLRLLTSGGEVSASIITKDVGKNKVDDKFFFVAACSLQLTACCYFMKIEDLQCKMS